MRCALEFRVWTLGQSSWEASHSPVFPTGVVCACAYVVFWGFRGGLAMEKDIQVHGVGSWSGSWRDRVQRVVQPGGSSLTCLPAGGDCTTVHCFIFNNALNTASYFI